MGHLITKYKMDVWLDTLEESNDTETSDIENLDDDYLQVNV